LVIKQVSNPSSSPSDQITTYTPQALILASTHPDYINLHTSTIGILFFGTPHQGSALANSAALIARFLVAIANKPHPLLLETLKKDNPILNGLTEKFKRCIEGRGIEVVSFYETRTMRGFKHLVSCMLGKRRR
jgi:hypothetical protein